MEDHRVAFPLLIESTVCSRRKIHEDGIRGAWVNTLMCIATRYHLVGNHSSIGSMAVAGGIWIWGAVKDVAEAKTDIL